MVDRSGTGAGGTVSTAPSVGGTAHGADEPSARMDQQEGTEWRWRLDAQPPAHRRDTIRQRFEAPHSVRSTDLQDRLRELLDTTFHRYRCSWPPEARYRRDRVIGESASCAGWRVRRAHSNPIWSFSTSSSVSSRYSVRMGQERDAAVELAQDLFQAARLTTASGCARSCSLRHHTSFTLPTRRSNTRSTTRISWPPRDFCSATTMPVSRSSSMSLSHFGTVLRRAAAGDPDQVERV